MSSSKKKYTKVGTVWQGEYGPYLILGESKNKNENYNYEVQILVKNSKGEKVALVKNPLLSLFDPRNRAPKEGQEPRKVPEKLLFEVSVAESTED